jgi:predicted amidohydrolase YtcJ
MKSYNLVNGDIITLDDTLSKANSVTIHNSKIESINKPNRQYQSIDLNGDTVIPGFIDAHFHLKNFGKRLDMLDLKGIDSLDRIISMIKDKTNNLSPNEWLVGYGWDQNLWPDKQYPQSTILNKISPNNPVYLTRIDGHSAWVNSAAITLTGMDNGAISKIEGGNFINGCIAIDNAMNFFRELLPLDSKEQTKKWIKIATQKIIKRGITGVHDAWQDRNTIEAIKELIEEEQFPIRCYGMLGSNDTALLNDFFVKGHYNSNRYCIRSVKAFIDGALGSRGAALHGPYCDDTNNCGLILISKDDFREIAELCYRYNYQLNTHAIGDRGNSYVLDCYTKILGYNNTRRWRIEHAQMVANDDLKKFKKYNILPSMQPSHCTSDMPWLPDRIGNERLKLISRWQSFIDQGVKIPGGSDCPIEEGNPLFEFYAAITRQDHSGFPKGGWQPQEKINNLNALKMFTKWAAYGGFSEKKYGKIQIGFNADLTVLSNNLLAVKSQDILDTKIKYTIVNGDVIYGNF